MKKIFSVLLVAVLFLTGCGSDIPELLEPARTVELYFTVERGTVSDEKIFVGTLAPATETVTFGYGGSIYDVPVLPGDEVKAGDVIYRIDKLAEENLANKEKELTRYKTLTELYKQQHDAELAEMKASAGGMSGFERDLYELSIKEKELENNSFNSERASQEAVLQSQYDAAQEALEKSVLTAPFDGTVVYMNNIENGSYVDVGDIAFVIADTSQKIVKFDYNPSTFFDGLESITVQIDGVDYTDVSFLTYSSDELYILENQGEKPYSRAVVEGLPEDVAFGTTCVIKTVSKTVDNVLYVPNSALKTENGGESYYCLVASENGGNEKAEVMVGMSSDYYTEIKSGLEEGDQVYFAEDASSWNKEMSTAEAYISNYKHEAKFEAVSLRSAEQTNLMFNYDAVVSEVFIPKTSGIYVEEGTPILSVVPDISEEEYEELVSQHEELLESVSTQTDYYDDLITSKQNTVDTTSKVGDKKAAEYELEDLKQEKENVINDLKEQAEDVNEVITVYDYCKENGAFTVNAPATGFFNASTTIIDGTGIEKNFNYAVIALSDTAMFFVNENAMAVDDSDSGEEQPADQEDLNDVFLNFGNKVTLKSGVSGTATESDALVVSSKNVMPYSKWGLIGVRLSNQEDISKIDPVYLSVEAVDIEADNVLLLDSSFIFNETATNKKYVLLQSGDNVITRYVQVATDATNAENVSWITAGLEAGDVCIKR